MGLTTAGLSGLALLSSGGALLPLIVGGLAYAGALLSENQRTKKLQPLPWVSSDLGTIAAGALHQAQPAGLGVQSHHYLGPEDKALFYLVNYQGQRLTQLAESMEVDQFDHILTNLVDHLITAHEGALNHPDLLQGALQVDFLDAAIANLPTTAAATVGAHTRLAAVEVAALPVGTQNAETPGLYATGENGAPMPHSPGADSIRSDWQAVFARVVNQAEFPSVFIFGRQGTGKTTTVNYLLSLITNRKVVLDPHYRFGAWQGCEVKGQGMNYAEIDEYITECLDDIQIRYQMYATVPNYRPDIVTVVCEELTNWAEHITRGKAFTKASLSDFRKAGYQSISVAHGETNTARGGATGTRKMRDEGEVHIKLMSKGRALVTFPDEEPFILHYPNLEPYIQQPAPRPNQPVTKPPVMGSAQSSVWVEAKAQMVRVNSPLLPVMEWIEGRENKTFTLTLAKENKQLRTALDGAIGLTGDSPRAKIEWAISVLLNRGLIVDSDGSYRQV
ncbi:hypothetical protein [Leptothoe sp. PORK10 BA2]|uniref:hypothetical protein n=1 Tax=Leptothoe sp. PORK10 BA2 TaxID=3110254 RepID=UPI002B20B254|nr:hypothetical protein [Leptothoe sp. PORK10 BA2]MEA5464618.1 hypothetical protein [Leptothoe sp. PORK10 BA2]